MSNETTPAEATSTACKQAVTAGGGTITIPVKESLKSGLIQGIVGASVSIGIALTIRYFTSDETEV